MFSSILYWFTTLSFNSWSFLNKSNTKEINANCEILNLQLKVFDKSLHKETSLEEVIKDIDKKNPPRLYGSGMLVLNAPWKLKEESSIVIPYLENLLKR